MSYSLLMCTGPSIQKLSQVLYHEALNILVQSSVSVSAGDILVLQKQFSNTLASFKKIEILNQEGNSSNQGNIRWRVVFLSLLSLHINGQIIRQGIKLPNGCLKNEIKRKVNKIYLSKKFRNSSSCICYSRSYFFIRGS